MWDSASERGLLACLMARPELMYEVYDRVPVQAFNIKLHAYLYQIMRFVYDKAAKSGWQLAFGPDAMASVARSLGADAENSFYHRTEGMEKVRDIDRLSRLIELNKHQAFVGIILDRYSRIRIFRETRAMQEKCLNIHSYPDATAIATDSDAVFSQLAIDAAGGEEQIALLASQEAETMSRIRINLEHPEMGMFYTHCPQFPRLMSYLGGGIRRKGFTLLVARPKVGKSTWLMNLCSDAARSIQRPVLFIDNEMSREEIFTRELSLLSRVPEHDILAGRIFRETGDNGCVAQAIEAMRSMPIYYVNIAQRPPSFLVSQLRQFRNKFVGYRDITCDGQSHRVSNPNLVVFDWLQANSQMVSNGGKGVQEHQLLGWYCQQIKYQAKVLDLAIAGGAQHSREALKLKGKDWGDQAGMGVGGSDRISMYVSAMLEMRNLVAEEKKMVADRWPNFRPGHIGAGVLRFDQLLHVTFNRNGGLCQHGIPLYHNRGTFRYEEIGDPQTVDDSGYDEVERFVATMHDRKKSTGRMPSEVGAVVPAGPAGVGA